MPVVRLVRVVAAVLVLASLAATVHAAPGRIHRVGDPVPYQYIVLLHPGVADVPGTARELAGQEGLVGGVWTAAVRGFWLTTSEQHALKISRDPRVKLVEENRRLIASANPIITNSSATASPAAIDSATFPASIGPHYRYHLGRISHRQRQSDSSDTSNPDYRYWPSDRLEHITVYVLDMAMNMYHKEFWTEASAANPPTYFPTRPQDSEILPDQRFPEKARVTTTVRDVLESNPFTRAVTQCGQTLPAQLPATAIMFPATVDINHAATGCMPYVATPDSQQTLFGGVGGAHATAVASMIAGRSVGVVPGVNLVPVMIAGCGGAGGDAIHLIEAMDWVVRDHRRPEPHYIEPPAVVNISAFGWRNCSARPSCATGQLSTTCPSSAEQSCLDTAIQSMIHEGIAVVTSSNNFGELGPDVACQQTPSYLSRSNGLGGEVISVGGVAKGSDRRWVGPAGDPVTCVGPGQPQSNYGRCVDIWAPAENLPVACRASYGRYLVEQTGDCLLAPSGTSYSAPIVAGVVARLLGEDHRLWMPPFTAELVWNRLRETATRFNVTSGTVGAAQGDLLTYIGGVTFARQPQPLTIRNEDHATLAPEAVTWPGDQLCYRWYRGESGVTSDPFTGWQLSPELTVAKDNLGGASSGRFWVRAQKSACDRPGLAGEPVPTVPWGDSQSALISYDNAFACNADIPMPAITHEVRTHKGRSYVRLTATFPAGTDTRNLELRWYEDTASDSPGFGVGTVMHRYVPFTEDYVVRVTRLCSGETPQKEIITPPHRVTVVTAPVGPRVRAVRHGGEGRQRLTFPAPASFTLQVPEVSAHYRYEWYRNAVLAGTNETLQETFNGETTAAYSVVTYDLRDGSSTMSLELIVTVTTPGRSGFNITVTPVGRMVPPSGTATLTVTHPSIASFSWYKGTSYGAGTHLADGATLTLADLEEDTTVWAQSQDGAVFGEFITIRVGCPDSLAGSITMSPGDGRVSRTEMATLSPIVSGTLVTYEWYKGTTGNTDQRVSIYPVLNVKPTQAVETYWLQLRDACDRTKNLSSVNVYLCVPTITQQPRKAVIKANEEGTVTIAAIPARDDQTIAIDWYRESDPAMTTSLGSGTTFKKRVVSGTETFFAAIRSKCISTTQYDNVLKSEPVAIEVCSNPVVASQSSSGWITTPGQEGLIFVNATGKELTYQWFTGESGDPNSQPIAGATEHALTIAPTVTTKYWCRITSQDLCVTNAPTITISVCGKPVIKTHPQNATIFSGTTTTLTADAYDSTPANTFQWYEQGATGGWTAIPNATSKTYTTPVLTSTKKYAFVVTSGVCTTWSNTATISMCTYPAVIGGPTDRKIAKGDTVRLELIISPAYDKTMTWFEGESGVTTKQLTSPQLNGVVDVAPSVTTKYWARVEHGGCSSRTTATTVQVCVPKITSQPQGGIVSAGTPRALTVGTNLLTGETFQWYEGVPWGTHTAIAGATAKTYNATTSTTKSYFVRVHGTCGISVDSEPATVTVCAPPVLGTPTGPHSIRSGQSANVGLSATGTDLTYQWYQGASGVVTTPVAGSGAYATVSPTATTTYWARVTSQGTCSVNGPAITVDVCTNPTISAQPASPTIRTGQTATLSVTASASPGAVTYQWYQGTAGSGTAIAGATSSSYTTPLLTADQSYWVKITRGACSTNSTTASVTVCRITAAINNNPQIALGQQATLTTTVYYSRVTPPTYTWYKGASGNTSSVVASGTNYSSLTVGPSTTTSYWVRVNDGSCTIDSAAATVSVCIPTITSQPSSVMVTAGQPGTLTAATSGAPLTYQWYIGSSGDFSQPVAGATSASLTIAPAATTSYWLRATGCGGATADSASATITVCVPPNISSGPAAGSWVPPGGTAYLTVSATGTNLSYQWYRGQSGNTSAPVFTNTDVVTFNPTQTDYYWVRVTGTCGTKDSTAVLQNVLPVITQQPANATIPSGSTATFTVAASGTYLSYQWYQGTKGNGTPIAGATSPSYTTPALTATTPYWVRVWSGDAFVYSETATATMCVGPRVTSYYANGYTIMVGVSSADLGKVSYDWYSGTPSNPAASTFLGTGSYYRTYYPTEPTTYWVRVWNQTRTCYTDTGGITLSP